MKYSELTDEELQAKAEEAGVEEAGSKTREQLVAALAKVEADDRSLVNTRGDFSSPNQTQGEEVSAADEAPREESIPDTTAKTGEIPPAEGEEADQSSLGGTGGTINTNLGAGGNL